MKGLINIYARIAVRDTLCRRVQTRVKTCTTTLPHLSQQKNKSHDIMNAFHSETLVKIAILIDGDNAESRYLQLYQEEASMHGRVTTKRIYGDWTCPGMKQWKDSLNTSAFRPIQKFEYTKNKNSTDTALIIDAMDLLHLGSADGFCIVSSDSDYTGLCHRIREHGKFVMGIGKKFTPEAFVNACDVFVYSEAFTVSQGCNLRASDYHVREMIVDDPVVGSCTQKLSDPMSYTALDSVIINPPKLDNNTKRLPWDQVDRAFQISVDTSTGEAQFTHLANNIRRLDPSFDHRHFGFGSFRKFCEALGPGYEVVHAMRPSDGSPNFSLRKSHKNVNPLVAGTGSRSSQSRVVEV